MKYDLQIKWSPIISNQLWILFLVIAALFINVNALWIWIARVLFPIYVVYSVYNIKVIYNLYKNKAIASVSDDGIYIYFYRIPVLIKWENIEEIEYLNDDNSFIKTVKIKIYIRNEGLIYLQKRSKFERIHNIFSKINADYTIINFNHIYGEKIKILSKLEGIFKNKKNEYNFLLTTAST